jgi:RimJ/RimL family protein N-acetyltransferase
MPQEASGPFAFSSMQSQDMILRPFNTHDRSAIDVFYADFHPKRSAQGLPPEEPRALKRWLDTILVRGIHLIALLDRHVIGHLMLMPMPSNDGVAELATFVHQSARNHGVGTDLNRVGVRLARHMGKSRVWLSVEPSNKAAIRSYEKAGFGRVPGSLWAPEIEMELQLNPPLSDELPLA